MKSKRELDNNKVKDNQNERKKSSMQSKREIDNNQVKENQNDRKKANMKIKRNIDNVKVKVDQVKRSRLSRIKKRAEAPDRVKEDQNRWQEKHRKVKNKSDRLKEFREATMYTSIFICTCCEQRMFRSNVQLYTTALQTEIDIKKPGHTYSCIKNLIRTPLNEERNVYICKTCVRHMKNKKIPPMSAVNGLQLLETDKILADSGLSLTELEGALIAKTIIFQKIYQLPKSRWTALKDRLINIPINDDDTHWP